MMSHEDHAPVPLLEDQKLCAAGILSAFRRATFYGLSDLKLIKWL